jgi:diguanylate cyclase (GGDEF)-like protein
LIERWLGALAGLLAVAFTFGFTYLPGGWFISGVVVAGFGWLLGGYARSLRRTAERDELTGISNRRPFERALEREWERAVRYDRPLSLLFLDADDFGAMNKRFGHLMGDEALKIIARQIRQHIRRTDLVARWGGEEFVVLLPETDRTQASMMAERIRALVEQCPVRDRDRVSQVTVSTGVASHPGKARSAAELLRQAIDGQAAAKVRKNAVTVVS